MIPADQSIAPRAPSRRKSSRCRRSNTPALAQLWKRLWAVDPEQPSSRGSCFPGDAREQHEQQDRAERGAVGHPGPPGTRLPHTRKQRDDLPRLVASLHPATHHHLPVGYVNQEFASDNSTPSGVLGRALRGRGTMRRKFTLGGLTALAVVIAGTALAAAPTRESRAPRVLSFTSKQLQFTPIDATVHPARVRPSQARTRPRATMTFSTRRW
jgi:hypothetical protein